MRKTAIALLFVSFAAACELTTSLEEDFDACVENARKLLPTTVTLTFRAGDPPYYFSTASFALKNGWESGATARHWVEGKASLGQRTDLFYPTSEFSTVPWMTFHSPDLETIFDVGFVLDPVSTSLAPDDGRALDFNVVDALFHSPACTWEGI